MKNNREYTFLLFLICFLNSCGPEAPSKPSFIRKIKYGTPEYRMSRPYIESFGTLSYKNKIEITAPNDGKVLSILKQEGDSLIRGEIFLELHNPELIIQEKKMKGSYNSALAACKHAKAEFIRGRQGGERFLHNINKARLLLEEAEREREEAGRLLQNKKQIFAAGGISEEAFYTVKMNYEKKESTCRLLEEDLKAKEVGFRIQDLLEAGYPFPVSRDQKEKYLLDLYGEALQAEISLAEAGITISEAELEKVQQDLKELEIQAPISGILAGLYVCEGEHVVQNTRLATLFAAENISAVFSVPEHRAAIISEGMETEISIDALGGTVLPGSVSSVSPYVDPESGNNTVKADIDNSDLLVKPGMFFKVKVFLGPEEKLLMIPEECLLENSSGCPEIFIVKDNRVFSRKAETGISRDGYCHLINGAGIEDRIILNPPRDLQEGEYVEY